jgi:hypothetical protein
VTYSASVVARAALALAVSAAGCLAQDIPPPQPTSLLGLDYTEPFFPGAHHDSKVPTPSATLGFPVGSKPATHAQIEAVIKAIANASPRCKLFEYGKTHEGRTLYYLVIASEANIQRLDALKADYARLADPREVSKDEGNRLASNLPALAWMAYVIHGDEMSGSDASLAVAHHLASSTDDDVKQLLDNEIVIIDPLMNPDGRDRYLTMLAQNRTVQPSVDDQSLLHTGFWPSGRMNHYLFDMNRDWIFATQPETRGRLAAINEWNPHYFMESHEMGSQDTFLFMPGREALNPNLPDNVKKWETRFADDQAKAFDAQGWRYYTGEWNDNWYPGYSSSWAALRGTIENLYEQAAISTDAVRRPEGVLHTYREAVHKQLVSTMTNLTTLAKNRREVLADFLAEKRRCVGSDANIPQRTFAIIPPANSARLRRFLDLLTVEHFEASVAGAAFKASGKDRLGREVKDREFPAGTLLIPARQPLARLVAAMLEFDPRMIPTFLTDERRELLRFGRSRIYDITAWSIPMTFDLEAVEVPIEIPTDAKAAPLPASKKADSALDNAASTVGFVIDGGDDASVAAAGRLMERGVWVRVADKPFQFDKKDFARGSVVITRKDNPKPKDAAKDAAPLADAVREVCSELWLTATGINTGMGPGDLPDLGGEHFILLHQPRIAIVGREPIAPYQYGEAWYFVDHVLGMRATYLDAHNLSGSDLRRYNVLVIPGGDGDVLKDKMPALKDWATAGGTIVAMGSSAAAFAKDKDGIGATRLLPDVLTKLDEYRQAVAREWEGQRTTPEPEKIWSFAPPEEVTYPWMIGESDDKASDDELKRRDAWRAIFMPAGAIVAGRVDDRSWLTAGCGEYVPVMVEGGTVLVSPPSVQAPVRMGYFASAPAKPEEEKPEHKPEPKKEGAKSSSEKPGSHSSAHSSKPKGDDDGDEDDEGGAEGKDKKEKKPAPGWTIAPKGYEMRLRMSGLLWPEAADRLANSAYVTREGIGSGQIILFAGDPNFRAATLGTARIFQNAVVFGPGMGASQPIRP